MIRNAVERSLWEPEVLKVHEFFGRLWKMQMWSDSRSSVRPVRRHAGSGRDRQFDAIQQPLPIHATLLERPLFSYWSHILSCPSIAGRVSTTLTLLLSRVVVRFGVGFLVRFLV